MRKGNREVHDGHTYTELDLALASGVQAPVRERYGIEVDWTESWA
jgi:hypothetical protein